MPRMIELIRASAVPATLVHSAARGALALPAAEMIEILVHLANHNKIFGQQARMTLAGWDEKSSLSAAADPATPLEVLQYLASPDNLRPALLPSLLENPSVPEHTLLVLASSGSREVVQAMLASARVRQSAAVCAALKENPNSVNLTQAQSPAAEETISEPVAPETVAGGQTESDQVLLPIPETIEPEGPSEVLDAQVTAFLAEHAAEIEAEKDKPFQPLGGIGDELSAESDAVNPNAPILEVDTARKEEAATEEAASKSEAAPMAEAAVAAPATPAHPVIKHGQRPQEGETKRGSALQKISKLDIKGRIQLAMKGTKEERSILIRDGTKIVALAVLESPKITDGEVETFASQKNVLEAVLRAIPMKRRYAKHYPVIRNLVFNPRTPMDVSLGLMKNLLVADLRNLSSNKQVSDTVRKLALKMLKQKMETTKKSSG
jgi:hypothetical protein